MKSTQQRIAELEEELASSPGGDHEQELRKALKELYLLLSTPANDD